VVDLGFDDCLCHYLGGLLPSEVGKVGLGIPDSKLVARARRAAADGAPAPPRERIVRWLRAAAGDGVLARRPH
jgi:hypothetical protein